MPDTAGTLRKLVIDGISFDTPADSNFEHTFAKFKNETIVTSGRNMRKMTKQDPMVKGEITANGNEMALLKARADSQASVTLAYTTAAGDTYRATGWIEAETRGTSENKVSVTLHPVQDWTPFLAA